MTAPTTKPRPLCLRGHEVRALLTTGRVLAVRVVTPQPPEWVERFGYTVFTPPGFISGRGNYPDKGPAEKFFRCPFGGVGTRLACRETWTVSHKSPKIQFAFRADRQCVGVGGDGDGGWMQVFHGWLFPDVTDKGPSIGRSLYQKWRPAAQMPLYASRLAVETAAVRVKRCRNVTEEEALEMGYTGDCPVGYMPAHRKSPRVYHFAYENEKAWQQNAWLWLGDVRRVDQ